MFLNEVVEASAFILCSTIFIYLSVFLSFFGKKKEKVLSHFTCLNFFPPLFSLLYPSLAYLALEPSSYSHPGSQSLSKGISLSLCLSFSLSVPPTLCLPICLFCSATASFSSRVREGLWPSVWLWQLDWLHSRATGLEPLSACCYYCM